MTPGHWCLSLWQISYHQWQHNWRHDNSRFSMMQWNIEMIFSLSFQRNSSREIILYCVTFIRAIEDTPPPPSVYIGIVWAPVLSRSTHESLYLYHRVISDVLLSAITWTYRTEVVNQTLRVVRCHNTSFVHGLAWARLLEVSSLIAMFMGPTWGPSGAERTQVGPLLAPWTLLSGLRQC